MGSLSDGCKKLLEQLKDAISGEVFIDAAEEPLERLSEMPDSFETVEPILKLMEENPEVDYGMPGPLVHFLEQFFQNGYEEKLVESLERRPTKHTVWMLNRIINGVEGDRKTYYLGILEKVIAFPGLEQDVKEQAQHFYSLRAN